MSLRFSERYGFKPVRETFQIEDMDDDLRVGIWNSLLATCFKNDYNVYWFDHSFTDFCTKIWIHFLKRKVNELPEEWYFFVKEIEDFLFGCKWYEVYDFIEFIAKLRTADNNFRNEINEVLEKEMSAYRLVANEITPIIEEIEIGAIEKAISDRRLKHVSTHLESALKLLSDRANPNYRNSIKESISAVEGVAKLITQDRRGELKSALDKLESQLGIPIHGALKSGFLKIYGYTSDGDGIRHALTEAENVSFEDAKFMLVACSAFVNYLIAKSEIN